MTEAASKGPFEWLESAERLWRPQLESAGLAVEVASAAKYTDKAARAFGMIYRADAQRGRRALKAFPGALIVGFTGVATSVYAGGSFWPGFWRTAEFTGSPQDQTEWGEAFLRGLRILGLPDFPNLPKRYLGPILLHAGIPTYCLPDYLHVVEVGMRRVGADASALVSWALPRLNTTFPNVDMPVRRFLEYGGDYAVDFVDQTLDALITLTEDADAVISSNIPERVVDAARGYLAADRSRGRAIKQQGHRTKPRLSVALAPYSGEIELRMPAVEDLDDDLTWEIRADGVLDRVRPRMAAGGRRLSILESAWRIDAPIRHLSVSAAGMDEAMELSLVDEVDPILFFQESGELLPNHMSLPPEAVWVLYALPQGVTQPDFASSILRTEMPPLGWTGWHLALVDLADLPSIRLSPTHPLHVVRTQSRATLSSDSEIPWIMAQGLPVSVRRPTLHLPDNISAKWRLRIRNLDTARLVVDKVVDSHADIHDELDPFTSVAGPLLGRFEISVKGPFGRGLTRNIALAEGLQVDPPAPWRRISPSGLEPLELTFEADTLSVDPIVLQLESQDSVGRGSISCGDSALEVAVSPPSMAVATVKDGVASRWSSGFVRVPLEDCHEIDLLVRVDPASTLPLLEIRSGDVVVQTVEPSAKSGRGYANYPLREISDTSRALRICDLHVESGSASVRVARIEPKRIASGATASQEALMLTDFSGGDVMVKVWSLYRPWIPAASAAATADGTVLLPSELRGTAPYVASWQRHDPWVPSEWPWMPDPSSSLIVFPVDGSGLSKENAEGFDNYQNEHGELSPSDAWALIGMARAYPDKFHWPAVVEMSDVLRSSPRDGMIALLSVPTTASHRIELLIQSGALWSRQGPQSHLDDDLAVSHARLLQRDSVIGLLTTLDGLQAMADSEESGEYWRLLREIYGHEIVSILTTAGDPAIRAGSFANARWLANLPEEEQSNIIGLLRLVPKAFLDSDSRTAAALELFRAREAPGPVSAGRQGRDRVKEHEAILRDWKWEAALSLISTRADAEGRGGWPTLSAQSAGFALLARLAARGDQFAIDHLSENFRHWLAIATAAPSIVAIDLVLAEAMAVAEFGTGVLNNPFANMTEEGDGVDD